MTDSCAFAYPTIQDFEAALPNVLPVLKSGQCPAEVDCPCFQHCNWVVTGYLLSVAYPLQCDDATRKRIVAGKKCENKDDLCAALESLKGVTDKAKAMGLNWDWSTVFAILIQILSILKSAPVPAP